MNQPTQNFKPETQKERWLKYGANVGVVSVIVIVLAILVSYLAQKYDKRVDTTLAGLYSLKPQTVNVIKDNTQKIKLVSLYAAKDQRQRDNPEAGTVRDLLEEYSRKGKNIEFQAIDPVTQSTDTLVKEAIDKYGGAVGAYKDYLQQFDKTTFQQLKGMTAKESAALADVKADNLGGDEKSQTLETVIGTIREGIPETLSRTKDRVDRAMKVKLPDYRAITDSIKDAIDTLRQQAQGLSKFADQVKDDPKVPDAIRAYFKDAPPRYEEIRKYCEDAIKKIDALGELKVSDLQQQMKGQDLILVLGENDWKVIPPEQVWVTDTNDIRGFIDNQQEIKPRFAGEQAVTTAILALTSQNKQKVVFVRATGEGPLTTPGIPPFQRGGPLSDLAEHLRDYNFDVKEKDITGMWEMQSRMQQQMPSEPEPSDADIKDAVWVVLDLPSRQGGPSNPQLNTKLAEHLKNGGSALVLAVPESDSLAEALKDYGISLQTDATIVHEMPKGDRARSSDWSEEVQSAPYVFVVNKFGDHMLTKPLQSLDMILAYGSPVRINPLPGIKQTPLIPIPTGLQTWGERDQDSIQTDKLKFDTEGAMPDIAPPFFAGAAAEKDKTRLVVFGALQSFTNQVMSWPDQDMLRRGILVARFPGNGELFNNAIFWLARMEPMIAISPSAMEVSRIADMSDPVQNFWHYGVLLILLPGLVLAAGIWMYFARRD